MSARIVQSNATPFSPVEIDPVTLDIIENALRNARNEMDATLVRTAMSPGIREQGDSFPLIADHKGRMIVGQFGSYIGPFLEGYAGTVEEGDMIMLSDPYSVDGAISHSNDWLVLLPVFKDGRLIAYTSMFGHMSDIGGKVAGLDADRRHLDLPGGGAHPAGQDLETGPLQRRPRRADHAPGPHPRMVQGGSERAGRLVPGRRAPRRRDGRAVRRRRVRLGLRGAARAQPPRDGEPDRDRGRRGAGQLRGLYLR